jgi:glutathione S-transferase
MSTVTLYGFPPSTYTRTVRMVCAELGVDHTLEPLAFRQSSHYALHPFGRMPVMRHGDVLLYETTAIAAYLDGTFGSGALMGQTPLARARVLQWCSAAVDYLYADMVRALAKETPPTPENLAAAQAGLRVVNETLAASPCLAGKQATLADLMVLPMLDFAMNRLGEPLAEGCPNVVRWRTTLAERPSARDTAA